MTTLKTFFYNGEHHFLLNTGETFLGTPSGVWASYTPPSNGNPGVVMMLYATKDSRHYVPHVLGALGIHALNTYGELPEGSHNLSPHSVGIQRRLAPILGQIPADAAVNHENWFNSIEYNNVFNQIVNTVEHEDITYDIENGKQFVLGVMAGTVSF
jgi:hypothetical protein